MARKILTTAILASLAVLGCRATTSAQPAEPRPDCTPRLIGGQSVMHCRSTSAHKKSNRARRYIDSGPSMRSAPKAAPSVNGGYRSARVRPVRALIVPADMPPRGVAGYGIVAFATRPLPQEMERRTFICEAYKAALLTQSELPAGTPLSEQMITFWPVLDKTTPEAMRADCSHLVRNYALRLGFDAIQDADKQREGFANRRGPFLVAWAPADSRPRPDSVVLVMDLSSLDSQRSFTEVFQDWRQQIVDNPQLWRSGFDIEAVRRTIRATFDRYGDGLMKLIKAGS